MRFILTGHRGLIGSALKKRLEQAGDECVMAIDKRDGKDINSLNYLGIDQTADVFFHFAAQCKINQSIKYPILPFRDNVEGMFNVLEYCRRNKIPKIMFSSSSRILSPEKNPYTASKEFGEKMLEAYRQCYGIEYIIIRPSTVYGPCYDETGRLLHNFVVNAIREDDLEIYGDYNKTLDFTYISDFIDAIILTIYYGKWNEEYNISGGMEMRVCDVANMVIREAHSKSKIRFMPQEIAQPQQVCVDISKIRELGFSPKIGIEEGVKSMIQWYRKHPSAWQNYKEGGVRLFNGKLI